MTLELNQAEFGSRVGFSAMAVSRWERGAQEPPAHGYIALGNLAPEASCWFFWERAGLRTENVLRVLPTLERNTSTSTLQGYEIVNAGPGQKIQLEKFQLVAIPLLKVAASSGKGGEGIRFISGLGEALDDRQRKRDHGPNYARGLIFHVFLFAILFSPRAGYGICAR